MDIKTDGDNVTLDFMTAAEVAAWLRVGLATAMLGGQWTHPLCQVQWRRAIPTTAAQGVDAAAHEVPKRLVIPGA